MAHEIENGVVFYNALAPHPQIAVQFLKDTDENIHVFFNCINTGDCLGPNLTDARYWRIFHRTWSAYHITKMTLRFCNHIGVAELLIRIMQYQRLPMLKCIQIHGWTMEVPAEIRTMVEQDATECHVIYYKEYFNPLQAFN